MENIIDVFILTVNGSDDSNYDIISEGVDLFLPTLIFSPCGAGK
jgi:hypothetical protein